MALDADGTLHISTLTIPTSDLVSPEYKNAYASHIAAMNTNPGLPAVSAPKAEWDKFDADFNRGLAQAVAWNLAHYPVTIDDTTVAGIHVGIISPKKSPSRTNQGRVLINLHGGGFFAGRGLSQGQIESIQIASIAEIKVLAVDYRQGPYYKYPAANEDAEAVYTELLKQYEPEAIGIFGGSAGGLLAAQMVPWLEAKGLPRPGAIGIFWSAPPSAPILFGRRGDSSMWGLEAVPQNFPSPLTEAVNTAAAWYMEGADINDPTAYPGSFESVLARFPPTLLLTGTRSLDMSPAIVAHSRLLKLGVSSQLYVMEGGWHGASLSANGSAEVQDANTYIARWFNQHLAR